MSTNHAAGEAREEGEEDKADDVEFPPACDGAANDAVEHHADEVKGLVERVDEWVDVLNHRY